MPDLDDLLNEAVPVEFEYRGRKFTLQAYPERGTRELRDECDAQDKEEEGAGDAHFIDKLVEAWDVTKGGQPLPKTREVVMRKLSPGLRLAMAGALLRESAFPSMAAGAQKTTNNATDSSSTSSASMSQVAGDSTEPVPQAGT